MGRKKEYPPCQHCGKVAAKHPRRLCWCCYYNLEIRNKYSRDPRYSYREFAIGDKASSVPKKPTKALPMTEDKMNEMHRRIARGESAFHPYDARYNLD